jgi:hypothetical protein
MHLNIPQICIVELQLYVNNLRHIYFIDSELLRS